MRFFVPPESIRGTQVYFSPEQSRQIARVLRLERGAAVFVFDNSGWVYTVRLEQVSSRAAWGTIVGREKGQADPPFHITLYQSLVKGERMDWVLQKGTEVGISEFIPIITARTVVRRREKRARWKRILIEATEQCGRSRVPTLQDVQMFPHILQDLPTYDKVFLAHTSEDIPRLREVLREQGGPPKQVALLIGPEGGFTQEEVEAAHGHTATIVHLGPRILRAETAGVIAAAILMHYWGDLA